MDKIDFRTSLKALYAPKTGQFTEIIVPPMHYLMIDGIGDPAVSKDYQSAVEALYSVAYPLKFMSKKEPGKDYAVPPLEGLWWADDMHDFVNSRRDRWRWTMMIMLPDWISAGMIEKAKSDASAKKGNPAIAAIRSEMLDEGLCLQIMHVGSYAEEAPVLKVLHEEFMPAKGFTYNGKHHEIYLGDPRKTAPEKLKTVLRQPVRKIQTLPRRAEEGSDF